jgi:acylphosphatase
MKRLHAIIYGRVQGVFFRYSTRKFAHKLGDVTGWVRNNRDGTVEVVAEGSETSLLALFEFLQHGPKHAVVKKVENYWEEYRGEFKKFHTA